MKNLLRFTALFTAVLMVVVIVGCAKEEEEKDTTPPKITSCSVTEGAKVPGNTIITITFDEKMKEATITVTGATGATALDPTGKTATWTPSPDMSVGAHKLTVTGKDVAGNNLDPAGATVNFEAIVPDTTKPKIDDAACDPDNGASGLDPGKITAIKIVANEKMKDFKMVSFEPKDAKVDSKFDGDKTITISFLGGYKLGNEMEIKVEVSGSDAAGNPLETTSYGFTTMSKEG